MRSRLGTKESGYYYWYGVRKLHLTVGLEGGVSDHFQNGLVYLGETVENDTRTPSELLGFKT